MRMKFWLIWGLALLLNAAVANAETPDAANLTGLKSFKIVVEDLDDEAKRCGITKDSLDTELRFILGQSRMQIHPSGGGKYIYLQVTVVPGCAASFSLQVHTTVTIEETHQMVFGATIWGQSGVRVGGNPSVDTLAYVDQIAKLLVIDWKSVNK